MAGHTSTSAAAANLTSDTNGNLQTSQEFITAFLVDVKQKFEMAFHDLIKDVSNNERLLEFVRSYYVNRLNTLEFCTTLQQRRNPTTNFHEEEEEASIEGVSDPILERFSHNLSCLLTQHLMMVETLQSRDKSFTEKLHFNDASKKVSAIFFTAAATICAAVAAANTKLASVATAAAILLIELRKWIHSLLKKRERAVKKHKEITRVMIMGINNAIKDLKDISVLSRRVQFDNNLAASLEELLEKANDYSCDMKWVKQLVLHTIIICS